MNVQFKRSVFKDAAKVAHLTYQIGETVLLRKKSREIENDEIKSKKIQLIISRLKKTLITFNKLTGRGKGIAAVQIGTPLKIAVVFINNKPVTLINPKILDKSKLLYSYPEMCMSASPVIAKVIRPAWVKVFYFDESGDEKIWDEKQNKIINRVIQHEIDHMEGVINIDLVPSRDLILNSDPLFFKNARFKKIPQTRQL